MSAMLAITDRPEMSRPSPTSSGWVARFASSEIRMSASDTSWRWRFGTSTPMAARPEVDLELLPGGHRCGGEVHLYRRCGLVVDRHLGVVGVLVGVGVVRRQVRGRMPRRRLVELVTLAERAQGDHGAPGGATGCL